MDLSNNYCSCNDESMVIESSNHRKDDLSEQEVPPEAKVSQEEELAEDQLKCPVCNKLRRNEQTLVKKSESECLKNKVKNEVYGCSVFPQSKQSLNLSNKEKTDDLKPLNLSLKVVVELDDHRIVYDNSRPQGASSSSSSSRVKKCLKCLKKRHVSKERLRCYLRNEEMSLKIKVSKQ